MLPVESLHSLVCSSAWDENKGLRVHGLTRPGRIRAKPWGSVALPHFVKKCKKVFCSPPLINSIVVISK